MMLIDQREVLEKDFKVYGDCENPLFLAKDVANWIEHNKPSEMLQSIDDTEKLKAIISHSGQNREMWFLTEDGLYEVLMQSRKPNAKLFKAKVKEILKDIRRHGLYATSETIEKVLADPNTMITILSKYRDEKERRLKAERQIEDQKPLVEFAETVTNSADTIDIGQLAKLAHDEHINIGRNRLFDWLRKQGYLRDNNEPYQEYINRGWFKIIEVPYSTPYGDKLNIKTLVTGKGQVAIIEKLRKLFVA